MKGINMPKAKNNKIKSSGKAGKALEPEVEILEIDEEENPHAAKEELDPDILAALESKRAKKKIPNPAVIDYIPELERDLSETDTSFGDHF